MPEAYSGFAKGIIPTSRHPQPWALSDRRLRGVVEDEGFLNSGGFEEFGDLGVFGPGEGVKIAGEEGKNRDEYLVHARYSS